MLGVAGDPQRRGYQKLCDDIFMLTCVLNGIRPEGSEGRQDTKGDNSTSAFKAMKNIATLLTCDAHQNPSGAREACENVVVAVTGSVNTNARLTEVIVFVPQKTGSKENVKVSVPEILQNWHTQSLDSHFRDVFAILEWFRTHSSPSSDEEWSLKTIYFYLYIVNHAPLGGAPDARTAKAHPEAIDPRLFSAVKLKTPSGVVKGVLQKNGLLPSTPCGNIFIVSKDNVATWLSFFCDIYEQLEAALFTENQRPKDSLTAEAVSSFGRNLKVFHAILKAGFIDLVLQDNKLDAQLNESYWSRQWARDQGAAVDAGGESPPDNLDSHIDGTKVTTSDLRAVNEDPRHHVVRYLKTIVAWNDAVDSLLRPSRISFPLRAYTVALSKQTITVNDEQIEEFKRELCRNVRFQSLLPNLEKILGQAEPKLNCHHSEDGAFHVEAGLMGVACACYNVRGSQNSTTEFTPFLPIEDDNSKRVLYDAFSVQETPIGVGELCCWCCWKLHLLLRGDKAGKSASSDPNLSLGYPEYPRFLLGGTHATIFPWYPPPCGVPESVLRKMNEALEMELEKLMKDSAVIVTSHQSSALSSAEDEVMAALKTSDFYEAGLGFKNIDWDEDAESVEEEEEDEDNTEDDDEDEDEDDEGDDDDDWGEE
ncbi:hypothetical protein OF83DRAFT_1176926 [Amylostereum chailletii]|nr:hypothetical protein OF83DRAFT_1176926 [Amylostereum chailletii]